jgi:hypothetical protein
MELSAIHVNSLFYIYLTYIVWWQLYTIFLVHLYFYFNLSHEASCGNSHLWHHFGTQNVLEFGTFQISDSWIRDAPPVLGNQGKENKMTYSSRSPLQLPQFFLPVRPQQSTIGNDGQRNSTFCQAWCKCSPRKDYIRNNWMLTIVTGIYCKTPHLMKNSWINLLTKWLQGKSSILVTCVCLSLHISLNQPNTATSELGTTRKQWLLTPTSFWCAYSPTGSPVG